VRGLEQQTSIYAAGVSGSRTDAMMLEERAREAMSPEAFAYVAGGAGAGATIRANRAAFDRSRIVPRMLRDERTSLPIVLKGILHADDARRAADEGIDGVVVSNHGGRQVDGAIATLDALPGVVAAVDGRIPVLFDSGIRSGADVFKALALGARAVLLGRPYVYGLALAGETGVREAVTNFLADFDLTMGLAGCASVAEIGPEALTAAP